VLSKKVSLIYWVKTVIWHCLSTPRDAQIQIDFCSRGFAPINRWTYWPESTVFCVRCIFRAVLHWCCRGVWQPSCVSLFFVARRWSLWHSSDVSSHTGVCPRAFSVHHFRERQYQSEIDLLLKWAMNTWGYLWSQYPVLPYFIIRRRQWSIRLR
jgi:hypothetical protein